MEDRELDFRAAGRNLRLERDAVFCLQRVGLDSNKHSLRLGFGRGVRSNGRRPVCCRARGSRLVVAAGRGADFSIFIVVRCAYFHPSTRCKSQTDSRLAQTHGAARFRSGEFLTRKLRFWGKFKGAMPSTMPSTLPGYHLPQGSFPHHALFARERETTARRSGRLWQG